jgi:hypothetical protein
MKTLEYLNTVSVSTVSYTDTRTPNVIFDRRQPKDTLFVLENNNFSVIAAANIIEIVQPQSTNIQYILELPTVPSSMVVDFGVLPAGCTVSQVGSVYTVSGIDSVDDWQAIKNPSVTFPITYEGDIVYNVSVRYNTAQGIKTVSWVVGTFIPFSRMIANATLECDLTASTAAIARLRPGFYLISDFEYTGLGVAPRVDWLANTANINFVGPEITEVIEDTWTVEVEPSNIAYVTDISENGTASSTFDSVNKILTITGTRGQVNDSLSKLRFDSGTIKTDFTFEYLAFRAGNPTVEYTRSQPARCMNLQYLTDARGTATYQTNLETTVGLSSPTVYDPDYTDPKGIYFIDVVPVNPQFVKAIGLGSSRLTRWATEQTETSTDINQIPVSVAYGSTNSIMAVGRYLDDLASTNAGEITIYEKTGNTWNVIDSVVGLNNGESQVGRNLLMTDDDTIIASGYTYYTTNPNDPRGRVLVYERNPLGWELAQTLAAPVDANDAWFGKQISATRNGDILAVSETNNGTNGRYGKVHIYTRTGTGDYTLSASINDPDTDDATEFGDLQVKLNPSGNRVAISRMATAQDTYFYTNNGGTWTLDETLSNQTRYVEWIDDDNYLWQDGTSFYVYQRQVGGNYTEQASFTPSDSMISFKINQAKDLIVAKVTGEDYIFIDFDTVTNGFVEQRINPSEMTSTDDWTVSDNGLEVIFVGRTDTSTEYGWKALTYTTKINAQIFDSETKTLSFYGTKSEIADDIDSLTLTSAVGVVSNITLNVSIDTPEGNNQTKSFTAEYTD